jgi:hypothetical protein
MSKNKKIITGINTNNTSNINRDNFVAKNPLNLTFPNRVFGSKNPALDYLSETDEKLYLFGQDISFDNGSKIFFVATREEVYDYIKKGYNAENIRYISEYIEDETQVKLHIDLDIKSKEKDEKKIERILMEYAIESIKLVNNKLQKEHGIVNPPHIILKSRNVPDKISGHIIFPTVVFKNIYDMKLFFLSLRTELIDMSIYRIGCLRTMYSCKKGRNNVLEYYKSKYYNKPDDKTLFMDTLVTN